MIRLIPALLLLAAALDAQVGRKEPIPPRPPVTADELEQGERLFEGHCGGCHGPEGRGALGPNLATPNLSHATDAESLFLVIDMGIGGTEMPRGWQLHDREIWMITAYVESLAETKPEPPPGDSAAGKRLYEGKGNCAACHWVNGKGSAQGPELSDVGARRSLDHLRQSLVEPAASVPEGFLLVTATRKDGKRIQGTRLNEDPFSIQIRDTGGALHSVRKSDLSDLTKRKGESSMPAYGGMFSDGEIDDLVSYMASLRGTR